MKPQQQAVSSTNREDVFRESVRGTYRTDEAGVVPGVTQSFDELITSLHREVAAMTLSAEECDII